MCTKHRHVTASLHLTRLNIDTSIRCLFLQTKAISRRAPDRVKRFLLPSPDSQHLVTVPPGVIFVETSLREMVQPKPTKTRIDIVYIWVFPKIGVGKPPKWMVYNGKPY